MIESPPLIDYTGLDQPALYRDPEVLAALRFINQHHLYWTEARRRPLPPTVSPELVWSAVKLNRQVRLNPLRLAPLPGANFDWLVTDATNAILHHLDMEMGGKLGTNQLLTDNEGQKQRYLLLSSLMEEAIASSQLEGAATTRVQAKEMLRKKRPPRDRSEHMIVNNYDTIQYVLANKHTLLTPELLCEIQRRMTRNTLDDEADAGRFRTTDEVRVVDVTTSEVMHTPPPMAELPVWLQAYCDLANETLPLPGFVHPIVRASMLHFLLGYIHPFADGNGRTARAVFYWYLLRKGYWLMEYLSISRTIQRASNQYGRAFLHTERDDNDLTYFINYQVKTLEKALVNLQEHLQNKLAERRQLFDVRRLSGFNDRQLVILQDLLSEPLTELTIAETQRRFGVVYATARADLQGLQAAGLLVLGKVGKQKLLYFRATDFEAQLVRLRSPVGG